MDKDSPIGDALLMGELCEKYASIASGILEDILLLEDMLKRHLQLLESDITMSQKIVLIEANPLIIKMIESLRHIQESLCSEDTIRKYDADRG